jgi:hypothetical protein
MVMVRCGSGVRPQAGALDLAAKLPLRTTSHRAKSAHYVQALQLSRCQQYDVAREAFQVQNVLRSWILMDRTISDYMFSIKHVLYMRSMKKGSSQCVRFLKSQIYHLIWVEFILNPVNINACIKSRNRTFYMCRE